jgi:hypothetical protein
MGSNSENEGAGALQSILQLDKLHSRRLDIGPLLTFLVPGDEGIEVLGRLFQESKDQMPVQLTLFQAFDRCMDKPFNILLALGTQDQVDQLTAVFSDGKGHFD